MTRIHRCNTLYAVSKGNFNYRSMTVQNEDPVLIAASYDAAWTKRGNGYTYDSLAGISNT